MALRKSHHTPRRCWVGSNAVAAFLVLCSVATTASARVSVADATCRQSIAQYLAGQKDMAISAQYVAGSPGASLFGSKPTGSLVFFAPTDKAWEEAAVRLSALFVAEINLVSGSYADGKALAAVLLYNVLLEGKFSAPLYGTRAALLKRGSKQSALGHIAGRKLPIHFTKKFGSVYATGAVRGSTRLTTPAKICGSLVYRSSTVMLPALNKAAIPQPK